MTDVETSLALAALAVESLEGRARFKLEAKYGFSAGERSAEVGADTDLGESIARIFTGYLTLLVGERGFRVERTPVEAMA